MVRPVTEAAVDILEEGGSGLGPPPRRTRWVAELAELGADRLEMSLKVEQLSELAGLLSLGTGSERR